MVGGKGSLHAQAEAAGRIMIEERRSLWQCRWTCSPVTLSVFLTSDRVPRSQAIDKCGVRSSPHASVSEGPRSEDVIGVVELDGQPDVVDRRPARLRSEIVAPLSAWVLRWRNQRSEEGFKLRT